MSLNQRAISTSMSFGPGCHLQWVTQRILRDEPLAPEPPNLPADCVHRAAGLSSAAALGFLPAAGCLASPNRAGDSELFGMSVLGVASILKRQLQSVGLRGFRVWGSCGFLLQSMHDMARVYGGW